MSERTDGRPIPNSYWVVEGQLLAGEYPGDWEPDEAQARAEAFVHCGFSTFIDLTEDDELDPYAELVLPARHRRFPIEDVSVPESTAQTVRILNAIDSALEDGERVYVHCHGGIGRTGLVVGCWLVRRLGGREGYRTLQQLWEDCPMSRHTGTPQTPEQMWYILNWPIGQ